MGYMNNWQFVSWLGKKFGPIKVSFFSSEFKEGISLDAYPGSEMFEFSFSAFEQDNIDQGPFSFEANDNKKSTQTEKMSICLVLLFENGKIADIRVPKKFACFDLTKRFQQEN